MEERFLSADSEPAAPPAPAQTLYRIAFQYKLIIYYCDLRATIDIDLHSGILPSCNILEASPLCHQ